MAVGRTADTEEWLSEHRVPTGHRRRSAHETLRAADVERAHVIVAGDGATPEKLSNTALAAADRVRLSSSPLFDQDSVHMPQLFNDAVALLVVRAGRALRVWAVDGIGEPIEDSAAA